MKSARHFLALLGMCVVVTSLRAQTTLVWTGIGDDGYFGTAENWSPMQSPGALDTAQFGPIGPIYSEVAVQDGQQIKHIEFLATRDLTYHLLSDYILSTMYVGGNITVAAGADVFFDSSLNLVLGTGDHVFDIASGTSLQVDGVVSGVGHFTKTGDGTLTLTAANTFNYDGSGGMLQSTAIHAGTVILDGGDINHGTGGDVWVGIDNGDDGTLLVQSGGSVSGYTTVLGHYAGSTGTAILRGEGSTWTMSADLQVGLAGTGGLTIEQGGVLTANGTASLVGYHVSSLGTIMVTDPGSAWHDSSNVLIGGSGTGGVSVQNGGAITAPNLYLGESLSGLGTLTVSGTGSSVSADVHVGRAGGGQLVISSGGSVSGLTGSLGVSATGSGTALISGSGSVWQTSNSFALGGAGSGVVTLQNQGTLNLGAGEQTLILGGSSGGSGTLNIGADPASAAAAAGILNAAGITTGSGSGTLQFNTTADVENRYYLTSDGTGGGNAIEVGGVTQLINTAGYTVLIGTNTYTGGTTIAGGYLLLGYYGTTGSIVGDVTFTGDVNPGGGELQFLRSDNYTFGGNISGAGRVSNFGDSILTLSGANTYSGDTFVGAGSLADGGAGAWSPNSVLRIASSATVLPAFDETIAGLEDYTAGVSGGVDFGTNTTVLTLNVSDALTFAGAIAGNGSVVKTGTGVQELTGANTYTGGTVVNDGTLSVNSGSISHALADVTVGDGDSDNGTLEISNSGTVTNDNSLVGNGSGSSGTATVDGAGSTWTSNSNLFVGQYGTGSVSVLNGGSLLGQFGYVGTQTGGTGAVEIDGTASNWTLSSNLYVGDNGAGSLKVTNGGLVADVTAHLGYSTDSFGCADIVGTGSAWNNSGALLVGISGTGDLKIAAGAVVTDTDGTLASLANSIGTALVTGSGSSWTNSGYLYVGGAGSGSLDIESGGYVSSTNTSIGNNAGGLGVLTVDGDGTTLNVDSTLYVGSAGTGTLNVNNGGVAFSSVGSVGNNAGGMGFASVDGSGSAWDVSNQLLVGNATLGSLQVTNGGSVSAYYFSLGVLSGVSGYASLGGNSTLTVGDDTVVGAAGYGTLDIYDGSDVLTTGKGVVGDTGSGTSEVTISGVGSSWTIGGNAYVGNGATGFLSLFDSGTINVGGGSGTIFLGHSGGMGGISVGYDGEVFHAGGLVNASSITTESGTGVVLFGTSATSAAPYYFTADGTSGGTPTLITGPTTVSVLGGYNVLSGANTYSGGTLISGGTLVMGSASALGSGTVTLNGGTLSVASGVVFSNPLSFTGGGHLGGSGTFGSLITVGNGVHLSPGNSPGTITFTSGLALADGGFLDFEVQAATGAAGVGYDTVVVSGGALDLSAVSAGGFTLKLISLNLVGAPGNVSDFDFTNSYSWTVFSTTGITGFNANQFVIDLTGFSNDISIGSFVLAQSGNNLTLNFTAVPEPSTWALLALGLAGGGLAQWRRSRRRA